MKELEIEKNYFRKKTTLEGTLEQINVTLNAWKEIEGKCREKFIKQKEMKRKIN